MAKGLNDADVIGWICTVIAVASGLFLLASCNDSRVQAIAAEEQIKSEVCNDLFPANLFSYSKNDTPETQNNMEYLGNLRDAYCNG